MNLQDQLEEFEGKLAKARKRVNDLYADAGSVNKHAAELVDVITSLRKLIEYEKKHGGIV